jgi:hypothetical protein
MKTNRLRTTIYGAALALVMSLGIVAALPATAQAQSQDQHQDDRNGRYDNQARWDRNRESRYAYLLGYHQAYSEGRDANDRRASYRGMPGYREGTNGYLARMGDRNTYRDGYRRGYKDGFEDAQRSRPRRYDRNEVERVLGGRLKDVYNDDRYDREDANDGGRRDRDDNGRADGYGRNDRIDVSAAAQENGHRDGLRRGEADKAQRRGYEYENVDEYRNALRGYRSEYGDRDRYRQAYREGYHRGYNESYRR